MWSGSLTAFGFCIPRKGLGKAQTRVVDPTERPQVTTIQGEVSFIYTSTPKSSPQEKSHSHFEEEIDAEERTDVDPITLETLGNNTFEFCAPRGRTIVYNAQSISNYFLKTGCMLDPVCRVEWSKSDIDKLQSQLPEYETTYSVSGLFFDITAKSVEMRKNIGIKQSLLSLENCLGELVAEVLQIIEGKAAADSAELNISLLLSQFEIPFEEMKQIDLEYTYHIWSSWLTFLKGPKIKPTLNRANLLITTLSVLECKSYYYRKYMIAYYHKS
jgi:hypothetical protein